VQLFSLQDKQQLASQCRSPDTQKLLPESVDLGLVRWEDNLDAADASRIGRTNDRMAIDLTLSYTGLTSGLLPVAGDALPPRANREAAPNTNLNDTPEEEERRQGRESQSVLVGPFSETDLTSVDNQCPLQRR
jgi:hypothetical protein